ncbi:hypothetical protein [Methanogenium cariaci]|uniref:hypothetical protein n=1 Tax=Methanogenium cariaci TaxID=2197 RepID=UPI0012F68A8A|nr:hypothetical protein [Methanogenium cariaci]
MARYQFPLTVLLCLVAVAVLACGCTDGGTDNPDAVSGTGTVVYNDLEGGFYGIVTDDGTRYLPSTCRMSLNRTNSRSPLRESCRKMWSPSSNGARPPLS